MMKPRKLLHLVYDGVPSLAKTATQRARRLTSIASDRKEHCKLLKKDFMKANGCEFIYRCEISPGTKLMTYIAEYISRAIFAKVERGDEHWTDFRVIISDSNEPGEGEQKIIMCINRLKMHSPGLHAICSKDSDVPILALITHVENILVYKYSGDAKGKPEAKIVEEKQKYEMVRISKLREIVIRELTGGEVLDAYEIERRIDDFLFITSLLGNDCLHHLAAKRDLGLDDLIQCYKDFRRDCLHLTEFDRILPENISKYLDLVAIKETEKMSSYWIEKDKRRQEHQKRVGGEFGRIPDMKERLENDYKQHYQGLNVDSSEIPALVCNYIRLLASDWQLISSGKSTCKGSYCSKKFSPFISHLVESDAYNEQDWVTGEELIIDTFTQQLLMLPHQCKYMLPLAYQDFRDEDTIVNMFGIEESEELEAEAEAVAGNRRAYIDFDQILTALKAKNPHPSTCLTEEEKRRNRFSNPLMFPNGRADHEIDYLTREADEPGDDALFIDQPRPDHPRFNPCRVSLPEYTKEQWEEYLRRA